MEHFGWMTQVEIKDIEKFFLNALLRIAILGVFLILASNVLLYPEDELSIWIAGAILSACIISYAVREKYPTMAVIITTGMALVAMVFQRLAAPSTTTTLSVVLIVGFIVSVMLKGGAFWVMHGLVLAILNTVFIYEMPGAVVAAITYSTLYFILSYASVALKINYDKMHLHLRDKNLELVQKASEIATRNEELLTIQRDLNALNKNLENIVHERTARIQLQNEILIKYSYTNAHHLRGPVARLLGLASVYRLDSEPDPDFIIGKMVDQAHEIDSVVKQINVDLEANPGMVGAMAGGNSI